jgi:hypothetical protein
MIQIRCSSLDRILACPGSLVLNSIVAQRESGEEALEGAALHHESALRIVRDLGGSAPDGLPEPDPKWPSLKFSKWISDYYVRHVHENAPEDWSLEVELPLSYSFLFQTPVPVTVVEWVDVKPVLTQRTDTGFILSGHIDCCAISPCGTRAIIWDLKCGYDPVDVAESNWQLLGYAMLLLRAYPMLKDITIYIVQPRNDEDDGFPRVSSYQLTECVDLQAVSNTFVRNVALSLSMADNLNTGRVQCKWCGVAMQCEAAIQERELMKAKLTQESIARVKAEPDDQLVADWVIARSVLEKPLKAAAELAAERIKATGEISTSDGIRITQKVERGAYKINDPSGLWSYLRETLPDDKLAPCAKWKMSEIKDALAEHIGLAKTGANSAEAVFDARIRPFVEQCERRVFQFHNV